MNNLLITTVAAVFLVSCASNRYMDSQKKGALMTTSALLVALPLLPVGYLYNLTIGPPNHEERSRLATQALDQIYAERIILLQARQAEKDAIVFADKGIYVFLPAVLHSGTYPGMTSQQAATVRHRANAEKILNDDFLSYLNILMSKDPEHQKHRGYYNGEGYRIFADESWQYKSLFNQQMLSFIEHD